VAADYSFTDNFAIDIDGIVRVDVACATAAM
jgi:hypothetical protein